MSSIPGNSYPPLEGGSPIPKEPTTGKVNTQQENEQPPSDMGIKSREDQVVSFSKSKQAAQALTQKQKLSQEKALNESMENRPNLDAYSKDLQPKMVSEKALQSIQSFFLPPQKMTMRPDSLDFLPGDYEESMAEINPVPTKKEAKPVSSKTTKESEVETTADPAAAPKTEESSASRYLNGNAWSSSITEAILRNQKEQRVFEFVSTDNVQNLMENANVTNQEMLEKGYKLAQDNCTKARISAFTTIASGGVSLFGSGATLANAKLGNSKATAKKNELEGELAKATKNLETYNSYYGEKNGINESYINKHSEIQKNYLEEESKINQAYESNKNIIEKDPSLTTEGKTVELKKLEAVKDKELEDITSTRDVELQRVSLEKRTQTEELNEKYSAFILDQEKAVAEMTTNPTLDTEEKKTIQYGKDLKDQEANLSNQYQGISDRIIDSNNIFSRTTETLSRAISDLVSGSGQLASAGFEKEIAETNAELEFQRSAQNINNQTAQLLAQAIRVAAQSNDGSLQLLASVSGTQRAR